MLFKKNKNKSESSSRKMASDPGDGILGWSVDEENLMDAQEQMVTVQLNNNDVVVARMLVAVARVDSLKRDNQLLTEENLALKEKNQALANQLLLQCEQARIDRNERQADREDDATSVSPEPKKQKSTLKQHINNRKQQAAQRNEFVSKVNEFVMEHLVSDDVGYVSASQLVAAFKESGGKIADDDMHRFFKELRARIKEYIPDVKDTRKWNGRGYSGVAIVGCE